MTACYGFVYKEGGAGSKCARCNEHFYAHSHIEYEVETHPFYHETRTKRTPIRLRLTPGEPCGVDASKGMPNGYRTAYDRMMDRQPEVCAYVFEKMYREYRAMGIPVMDVIALDRALGIWSVIGIPLHTQT